MTKVLFAIDSLTGGGAERILVYLARSLVEAGIDVEIVLTLGTARAYEIDPRVRVQALPGAAAGAPALAKPPSRGFPGAVRHHEALLAQGCRFAAYAHRTSPDCIVSFLPNSNVIALLARRVWQIRAALICADHNTLSREIETLPAPLVFGALVRILYPCADAHVSVSRGSATDLHLAFGVPLEKIVTIYNGVDLEGVRRAAEEPLPTDLSERLSRPDGIRLVTVGRLAPQKAHEDLLEALAKVCRLLPCHLFLVGEGPREGALRRRSAALGIEPFVHFLGWQPNPFQIVRAADVFVLTSRWEGLPTVLIEALAVGTPVVSTDCPNGPREILLDGFAGVLTPVADAEALAGALLGLARDGAERSRLRSVGPLRADEFSLERMSRQYLDVVKAVVQ